jgi:hypothetical protein
MTGRGCIILKNKTTQTQAKLDKRQTIFYSLKQSDSITEKYAGKDGKGTGMRMYLITYTINSSRRRQIREVSPHSSTVRFPSNYQVIYSPSDTFSGVCENN